MATTSLCTKKKASSTALLHSSQKLEDCPRKNTERRRWNMQSVPRIKHKVMETLAWAQQKNWRTYWVIITRIRQEELLETQMQVTFLIEQICRINSSNLPWGSSTELKEELTMLKKVERLKACNMRGWHFGMQILVWSRWRNKLKVSFVNRRTCTTSWCLATPITLILWCHLNIDLRFRFKDLQVNSNSLLIITISNQVNDWLGIGSVMSLCLATQHFLTANPTAISAKLPKHFKFSPTTLVTPAFPSLVLSSTWLGFAPWTNTSYQTRTSSRPSKCKPSPKQLQAREDPPALTPKHQQTHTKAQSIKPKLSPAMYSYAKPTKKWNRSLVTRRNTLIWWKA